MSQATVDLTGKSAIVTGSSRRIGRAIAMKLADAGAGVVINARTSKDEADAVVAKIEAAGGKAVACLADVSDEAAVANLINTAVRAFGGLDIVVHNAVARQHATVEELALDDWHQALGVVLDGAFLCSKHAVPHLEKLGGTIIFIGGATAFEGGRGPAVPTGKAGLVGLTRTLARTLGPKGITANIVSLGSIEDKEDDPERVEFLNSARPTDRIPLRRLGTPDDVAEAVLTMCGPGMRYVTGQVLNLTGGYYMG